MDGTLITVTIFAGMALAVALFVMFYIGWLWCYDTVEHCEPWAATAPPEFREEAAADRGPRR